MTLGPGTELAGRYRVESLLGRGGMGEVWRCTDLEQERSVAVKLVHDAAHGAAARWFLDEVVATAHLRHPGVVAVYDLVRSGSDLALVMELCEGQPLSRLGRQSFAALRPVLLEILEALAYAHARGVLHLDIKPDNVMVHVSGRKLVVKLLDFGIAQAWRAGPRMARRKPAVAGTVPYMAPEQLLPGFGAFGPWTDLFAFGAMTHHLLVGRPPFTSEDPAERILRHPPRIDPFAIGAPERLVEIVGTLLRPRERDRPTHAADVIAALRELPEVDEPPSGTIEVLSVDERTEATVVTAPTTKVDAPPTQRPVSIAATGVAPPEPSGEVPEEPLSTLARAGPGAYALVGLVEPALCGRDADRARIWRELVRARTDRELRVVEITGPLGTGKSRLARDTRERAHQHGLAHVAFAAWGDGEGNHGLRRLLDDILMTANASTPDSLRQRVERWVERFPGEDDRRFTREAVLALDAQNVGRVDADLLIRAIVEALARASEGRSVVVSLDDVDAGRAAVETLVARLRERSVAVALVTTSIDHALEDADLRIRLSPLGRDAIGHLVRGVLDVDDGLVEVVADRSGGNPLLTTQLVAELVSGRKLERRAGKHGLRDGVDPESIPRDLSALWSARVERSGADPACLGALALVRARVSDQVLDHLAGSIGPKLHDSVDAAMRAGLLRRSGGSTSWVHASLRAHLCEGLSAEQREAFHDAAADALGVLVGREDIQHQRATHLLGAGRVTEACAVMTEAIAWSHRRAEEVARRHRAETLLGWATVAGLPRYRARALAELAHADAAAGNLEQAAARIEEAVAIDTSGGEPSAWVTWRRAQVARFANDAETAHEASLAALERARAEGQVEVESLVTGQLALDSRRRRDFARAEALFERAAELARRRGDLATEAHAMLHLGNMAPAERMPLLDQAVDLATQAGDSKVELTARQVRADALFESGQRERAAEEMRTVGARARTLGIRPLVAIVEITLACWALADRNAEAARAHHRAIVAAGAARGSVTERSMCAAIGAATSALEGQTGAALADLETLATCRGDNDEPELRRVLEIGAERARGDLAQAFAAALRS